MKRILAVMAVVLASGVLVSMGVTITDVESHATPQLVAEINTAIGQIETQFNTTYTTNLGGTTVAVTNNMTVAGTLAVTKAVSANGGLNVTGNQTNSGTFTTLGNSSLGGTTVAVTNNMTVAGTLGVTGVGTFTAESVHNGGIDSDYITTDAAAGIDCKTSGALKIGAATATSIDAGSLATTAINLNATTVAVTNNATVAGTLGVTGVATLTAAPRLNAARGTPGTVVLNTGDGPAGTTTNALYVPVNIGGTNCWIMAWPQ